MSEVPFQPFQRVLVRDVDKQTWKAQFFSHISGDWYCCMGSYYKQCLPYEGNEYLIGTTNNPTPLELEFKFGDKVEVCFNREDNWIQAIFFNKVGELYSAITRGSDKAYMYQFCRHADW